MFTFEKYNENMMKEWDDFVEEKSINGSFLQTRRFLNYHPQDRFTDASLFVYNHKHNICAVIPACVINEGKKKIFLSHKGSTFGGIIIDKKHYRAKYVMPMIEEMLEYLKNDFQEILIKQPSDIFCLERMDLFYYAFQQYGFYEYKELNTYIDFLDYSDPILKNFSQGKRTNIHNCEKNNLYVREITTEQELDVFYKLLIESLKKYNTVPVHSFEELKLLQNDVLVEECAFYGCYMNEKMVAGSMMFYFKKSGTAHTQYLAADPEYNVLSPMSYMYYSMIKEAIEQGYKKISWGIATEDFGRYLNKGLITSKEDYGSMYCCNLSYGYTLSNDQN